MNPKLKGFLIGAIIGIILYFLGWMIIEFINPNFNPTNLLISPICSFEDSAYSPVCFVVFGLPFNIIVYGTIGFFIAFLIDKFFLKKNKKKIRKK